MKRYRKISLILLSISAFVGLVRGFRMTGFSGGNGLIYPYSQETIKDSLFSNYAILGWVLFCLVGVFSLLSIGALLKKTRNYAYFIIVEGIFATFFSITNIFLAGFSFVHILLLPLCISMIILGVLQTPKEF